MLSLPLPRTFVAHLALLRPPVTVAPVCGVLVAAQVTGPSAAAAYDRADAGDMLVVCWPSGRQAAINTLVVQATVILLTHHPGPGEGRPAAPHARLQAEALG